MFLLPSHLDDHRNTNKSRRLDWTQAAADHEIKKDLRPEQLPKFSRLRGFVTNALRRLPTTSASRKLGKDNQQPRVTLVSYAKLRSLFAVARRTPPRPQATYELRDDDEQFDRQPSSAAADQSAPSNAGASASANQDQLVGQGGRSTAPSSAYAGGAAKPATQSMTSNDSFEVDCCWCCPRWCRC
ncbi:hypothetical protein F5I97DRAFT_399223 [Phlebopus sp. FC_14]|nr:hypothetical protein F5I97DRAFT_399223 [Phlebopus sp. FC_14]